MLSVVAKHIKDVSVLRRLLFAAKFLPRDMPNFWGVAIEFATAGKVDRSTVDPETAAALIENIHSFDERAFDTDEALTKELISWMPTPEKPLGVILISPQTTCALCGQSLVLRKDRPTSLVIYDIKFGSIPGSHYYKTCSNKLCTLTQYYGYYTTGREKSQVIYNINWGTHPYLVSSSLTAFSISMLKRMDSEVVIGQLSYKQIAEIFNHTFASHLNTTE